MTIKCEQQGRNFVITSTEKPNAKAFVVFIEDKQEWRINFYHSRGNNHYRKTYPECLDFLKSRGYK